MKRDEFLPMMAYLSAGAGKPLAAESAEVYWDLLADLPAEAVEIAVKRSLLESEYPVIPPVGTLRKLAVNAMQGPDQLGAHEAYGIYRQALVRFGYNREEEAMRWLPPLIRAAAQAMGWQHVCASTEHEIVRAQFCRTYDVIAARCQRERSLPAPIRERLEEIGRTPDGMYAGRDPRSARQVLAQIGVKI